MLGLRKSSGASTSELVSMLNNFARLNCIQEKDLVEVTFGDLQLYCILSHLWRGGKLVRFFFFSFLLVQKSNQKRTPEKDYISFSGWFPD